MKKIPTLFVRDNNRPYNVIDKITPGCEWVTSGLGQATQKLDGTCVKIEIFENWRLYKRREVKSGTPYPADFQLEEEDQNSGKSFGWVPVEQDNPEDKYHTEGFHALVLGQFPTRDQVRLTYELIGPKIQGNPEKSEKHILVLHGTTLNTSIDFQLCPRTFQGIRDWIQDKDIEGVVWWKDRSDPQCDKVKIKKKDFGFKR